MGDDMGDVENYKEQLRQVEAALAIDEKNEDLKKLKDDLLEVIALTEELAQINEAVDEKFDTSTSATDGSSSQSTGDDGEWKVGDRMQALRKGEFQMGTIDMIADDKLSCTVKFDNSKSVDLLKLSELQAADEPDYRKEILLGIPSTPSGGAGTTVEAAEGESGSGAAVKNKVLTKEELERRREQKKKKLLKKKQRMKDFEEAREAGKQRWQNFYKKGSLKGKHKVKGLNKKSIFASREDGKGKIGIGTCGTSGGGMTDFTPASAYMYKK